MVSTLHVASEHSSDSELPRSTDVCVGEPPSHAGSG